MTSKSELSEEIKTLKDEQQKIAMHIKSNKQNYNSLTERISEKERSIKMLKQEPHVSDHAVLRYIQRRMGFDLDAIRAEIMAPTVYHAIKAGAVKVTIDGYSYMVSKEGCITTVIGPDMTLPKART